MVRFNALSTAADLPGCLGIEEFVPMKMAQLKH